jgi:hypothetical protein
MLKKNFEEFLIMSRNNLTRSDATAFSLWARPEQIEEKNRSMAEAKIAADQARAAASQLMPPPRIAKKIDPDSKKTPPPSLLKGIT